MKPKIYTRTGDNGETSLIGKRISKDAEVLDVLGILDELNSSLGILLSSIKDTYRSKFSGNISRIQDRIFTISSLIAGGKVDINLPDDIQNLESEIDEWTSKLPELTNFILPGGIISASQAHMARTICRAAERTFVGYTNSSDSRPENYIEIRQFINRLSDWLFTMARILNYEEKVDDVIWNSRPDELKLI